MKHDFENKSVFKSGDVVNYDCVDFLSYKQKRICSGGHWTGAQARCGYSPNNDLIRVTLKNCSDDKIVLDINHMRLENKVDSFVNAFSYDRYNEPIRASGGTCHKWHLTLTDPSYFSFVRVDFATAFDSVSKAVKVVPEVKAFVVRDGISNSCPIEAVKIYKYVFTNKWISYGNKYHYYIKCHTSNGMS